MNYDEFIQEIINTRGQWSIPENEYWEGHHIIPKCFGGKGTSKSKHINIIRLYPEEHFIAHKLLVEKYPDSYQLIAAFWYMCNKKDKKIIISAEDYGKAKRAYSIAISKRLMGHAVSDETKQKLHDANKGKKPSITGKHLSEDIKKKLSKSAKLRGMPIAGWNKGIQMSTVIKDMSKYGMSGKKHSKETKERLSSLKKGTHPKTQWAAKKVICIETNIIYESVCEAKRQTGICHIDSCCRGERLTAGGYHWKYID